MSSAQVVRKTLASAVRKLDWDCHTASTRFLTHGIHRYSGKFIPQVASQMIQLLTSPGEMILDPYCGSGTTLLEAMLQNRRAVGLDLNPMAVLISRVKCTPISGTRLRRWQYVFDHEVAAILDGVISRQISVFADSDRLSQSARSDPRLHDMWFKKWFHPDVLRQLVAIDTCIRSIPSTAFRLIAWVALSDILRRSSNASPKYPNVMFDRTITERPLPGLVFRRRLREICDAVAELGREAASAPRPEVLLGDTRHLPIQDGTVDAIVTHPPYIGSIPYAEYQSLSLTWLGHDPRKVDACLTGGRRQSADVIPRYEDDLRVALQEFRRVLKPRRFVGILIGNPVVKGRIVQLDRMIKEAASVCGFALEAQATRRGINRRANKMPDETLLFFRKG